MSIINDTAPRWEVSEHPGGGKLINLVVGLKNIGTALYDPPTEITRGSWNVACSPVIRPGKVVSLPVVKVRSEDTAREYLAGIAELVTGEQVSE